MPRPGGASAWRVCGGSSTSRPRPTRPTSPSGAAWPTIRRSRSSATASRPAPRTRPGRSWPRRSRHPVAPASPRRWRAAATRPAERALAPTADSAGWLLSGAMTEQLSGVYPILSTPFDEARRVDVESLEREAAYLIEAGVDGLGLGLASEVPRLTEAERDLVLDTLVRVSGGRVPVVMKSDAEGTDLALHYSRRAAERGATGLMVMPPPGATASGVRAYYHEI